MEATQKPKNLTRPATAAALLDALDSELWKDDGSFLRPEDVDLTFRKREFGGYHVEYRGLYLGWVTQRYDSKLWDAYTADPDYRQARGVHVCNGETTRYDAAQDLMMRITRRGRADFLAAVESRWDFWHNLH